MSPSDCRNQRCPDYNEDRMIGRLLYPIAATAGEKALISVRAIEASRNERRRTNSRLRRHRGLTARGRQTRAPSPPPRSPYLYRTIKPGAGEPALTKDNAAQSLIGTPITGMGFNCRFSLFPPPPGGPPSPTV